MSNIDWTQLITAETRAASAAALLLSEATEELALRRAVADKAIAPLQDAVDFGDATDEETQALTAWKKYRIALSRLPSSEGYPNTITWPVSPTDE